MPIKPNFRSRLMLLGASVLILPINMTFAQSLDSTVNMETQINQNSAASQSRVSNLARQTQDLLSEFRVVVRETESLKIYNDNLQNVVDDQHNEMASIEMISSLERIVEADIPFRIEERRARVVRLRQMMDQAEVTASEKYRQVMEVFQSELEFGRTTEAYSDALPTTGQTVEFLRVGRMLLVYQTSDHSVTGWFNPRSRVFEELDDDRFRLEVKDGLAIARNEKAPNLVMLPVPGPKAAK